MPDDKGNCRREPVRDKMIRGPVKDKGEKEPEEEQGNDRG